MAEFRNLKVDVNSIPSPVAPLIYRDFLGESRPCSPGCSSIGANAVTLGDTNPGRNQCASSFSRTFGAEKRSKAAFV